MAAWSAPCFADSMSGVGRGQVLRVRGRGVAWLPPLLLLVAITAIDYNTAAEFRMISWVVLVPGIAAAICGVVGTAVFAALALVTYVVADSSWPHQYQSGLPDFILVAVGGILAVLACAVRLRGERSMLHMRDVADTTRRTVLRPLPPVWGGLEHAEVYLAADSEARVGGDFYDIQPGPHGTRVLVGDVQGKGLGAVEEAAALLGTFREAAYHEPALATVAERLEIRVRRRRRACHRARPRRRRPLRHRRPARLPRGRHRCGGGDGLRPRTAAGGRPVGGTAAARRRMASRWASPRCPPTGRRPSTASPWPPARPSC